MVRASVRTHFRKRIAVSLVFLFALGTSGPRVVHAATLTVSNTNDNGAGSLRQAIFDASPGDTITFSSALTGQTITLTSGELVLDKNLTVTGPGASQLAISGNHASRVFHALNYVTTTIQGLTIRDAYLRWNFYDNFGGGIKADSFGALTVNNSAFIGNECEGGRGGAISDDSSTLTVTNTLFSRNSAYEFGGAIGKGAGTLTVNDSTFSDNFVRSYTEEGLDGYGGGAISSDADQLVVTNSTFSGNSGGWGGAMRLKYGKGTVNKSTFVGNNAYIGGAIMADCDAFPCSELTVNNSTFSSNSASFPYGGWEGQGGALAAFYGEMWINDSTFSGNSASAGGGGIIADAYRTASVAHIKNSLIADSTLGGNCAGDSVIATGVNFSTDNTCPGFTQVTSAQLNLGPLADNGGPTRTHAVLAGSVAIDAAADCTDFSGNPVTVDQRGVPRPQSAACDTGAFELRPTYAFFGFLQPVDNLPTVNVAKAGTAIPVKFSLSGYRGLNIFAAGSPSWQVFSCSTSAPTDNIEVTVTAAASGLGYDPATDTYSYVWKTNSAWKNTCGQLLVKLNDDTIHSANFQFK